MKSFFFSFLAFLSRSEKICNESYEITGGIYVHSSSKNGFSWFEAADRCHSSGGHLLEGNKNIIEAVVKKIALESCLQNSWFWLKSFEGQTKGQFCPILETKWKKDGQLTEKYRYRNCFDSSFINQKENRYFGFICQTEEFKTNPTRSSFLSRLIPRCTKICPEHSFCEGSRCTCEDGYSPDPSSREFKCVDINECLFMMHDCNLKIESCQNLEGSFQCVNINDCEEGFIYDSDWKRCTDVDECASENSICEQECANTEGSFYCECKAGYEQSSRNAPCYDIDECDQVDDQAACGINSICENTSGSFSCSCKEGFVLENGNCKSRRINECLLGTHSCDVNAECLDTKNGFNCLCFSGFIGDGFFCDDLDECALRKGDENYCENILENSECVNTFGSFECKCNSGFILKNEKCVDVDECSSFSKICPSNSNCVNTAGSAFCECENGFQMNENGFCDDFNECESEKYRCDENAKCINTDGSFKCDCRAGFIMKNGSCERKEINECVQKTHNCEQVCNDKVDGFYCSCFPGYELTSPDGSVCEDSDECLEPNICGQHQKCTNSIGSFACHCVTGYEVTFSGEAGAQTCGDINECDLNACDEVTQICQNSAGSFKCECRRGFENIVEGTGPACQDINECEMANNCSLNSECVNSFGSYSCSCLSGYKNNEALEEDALESEIFFDKCIDIDECEEPELSCLDSNSYCVNIDGSFECSCLRGFLWSADSESSSSGTCADVDECDQLGTGQQACGAHQDCTNTAGSYFCTCSDGYNQEIQIGSQELVCVDIAECSLNISIYCGPFSICENTEGSFSCFCEDGFQKNDFNNFCEDIDECLIENKCGENGKCENSEGSFDCICEDGFSNSNEKPICFDIDECENGIKTEICQNGKCQNKIGSFECICDEGFVNNSTGDCIDLDECATSNHDCSPRGECSNSLGSFTCACPNHLIGDGFKCVTDDDPYDVQLEDGLEAVTVDICDFGVVKFSFSIKEHFDRTVRSLCLEVFSSDNLARTDPQIIRNVKASQKYEAALLADLADVNEKPYISICPCNQTCESNNLFVDMIDDECRSSSAQDFKKSLTASYSEKRTYAQTKMKFVVESDETLARTSEVMLQNCYEKFKNDGLVSCKILASSELSSFDGRSKRARSSKSLSVGATFKNQSAADGASSRSDEIAQAAAQVVGSVLPLISMTSGTGPFITQLIILLICSCAAGYATYSKIIFWLDKPRTEQESKKDLAFSIGLDYIWPILGVYPSIVVWFEYRVNENLFTDPLDDIGSCMVYISVCKLYLFLINLFFMDQVYRETKFIADYPILNDIFLDHGIISFIMCDSIDTFIVYFYSSRYQAPDKEVGIANFWLPTFQFLMAFIPAIISIVGSVREYLSEGGAKKDEKWWIRFISEIIGAFGTVLATVMFVCCTAITICIKSESALDPRLSRVLPDGSIVAKNNTFTNFVSTVEPFWFCTILEDSWFTDVRFTSKCAPVEPAKDGFQIKAKPFSDSCFNPLEVIALATIISIIAFQLCLLLLLVFVYYFKDKKKIGPEEKKKSDNFKIKYQAQRRNRIMARVSRR